ncbi:hypothetical protein AKJ41_05730 [candidate division MSBL1 archaeon SCGC-AAA259O05]|uniref:PDZ domain-containing protein n=1 Tax=candidate division MSBL1 archaeon SCGC-AAA259O05 TaxID=1698271 RepID=A0A133UYJ3_9EURY|nr:hypothetical protein AKJ41_05730 [candidate division MSBL1 archaeon SCGC-AAA259O05]
MEQDEEEYEKASPTGRICPTSAGPMANLLLGVFTLGLLLFLVTPHPGVPIGHVQSNSPASEMGLHSGDRITGIEGHKVFNSSDLARFLRTADPGEKISLSMEEKHCTIILRSHPENENVAMLPKGVQLKSGGPVCESQLLRPMSFFIGLPYSVVLGDPVFNQADYTASIPWTVVHRHQLYCLWCPRSGFESRLRTSPNLTSGHRNGVIPERPLKEATSYRLTGRDHD